MHRLDDIIYVNAIYHGRRRGVTILYLSKSLNSVIENGTSVGTGRSRIKAKLTDDILPINHISQSPHSMYACNLEIAIAIFK